jgi:hypothetical protein
MSDERVLSELPAIGRIDLREIEKSEPVPSEQNRTSIRILSTSRRG